MFLCVHSLETSFPMFSSIFFLFLTAMLQAVRALMIVGIVLGAFGLLVATFSLKCLRMGNMEDSAKASMTLAAGVMSIVAGELEFI